MKPRGCMLGSEKGLIMKRRTMNRSLVEGVALVLMLGLLLAGSAAGAEIGAAAGEIGFEKSDPEEGATLSRPPQSLRLWFSAAPNVAKSELELEGPTGKLELQGQHTMGENDLMVRIVGRVVDGEYTVRWKVVGGDGAQKSGEWKFTVQRGG